MRKNYYSLVLFFLIYGCHDKSWPPSNTNPNSTMQPQAVDVVQLGYGDCWLMATLSALALETPQVITNAIVQVDDYNYIIRFYDYQQDFKQVYVPVNINDIDPNSSIVFGNNGNVVYWPALIEVAYGKYYGYAALNFGGAPSWALEMLTGTQASDMMIDDLNPNQLYEFLNNSNHNIPVIIATDLVSLIDRNNLVKKHGYTVICVENPNSIVIRNPWGNNLEHLTITQIRNNFISISTLNQFVIGQ